MRKAAQRSILSIGNAGWVRWTSEGFPFAVLIRFEESPEGRLDPIEVYLGADQAIDARILRRLPLGQIQTWANGPDARESIRARLGIPGPDVRRLASHYATTFGKLAPDHWVKRSFAAQLATSGEPQAPAGRQHPAAKGPPRPASARVQIPKGGRYPDSFYESVAAIHSGGYSAQDIADVNHVPFSTVYRWLKEARQRGVLPPARRRKRGINGKD